MGKVFFKPQRKDLERMLGKLPYSLVANLGLCPGGEVCTLPGKKILFRHSQTQGLCACASCNSQQEVKKID